MGKPVPALSANLRYHPTSWSVVGNTEGSGIGVEAPVGWRFVQLGDFHARFSGPGEVWSLRVNGMFDGEPKKQSAAADARLRSLQSLKGFELVSRSTGRTTDVNNHATYTFSTLVYRHTGADGSSRLVLDRFVDDSGFAKDQLAYTEVVVAGRPIDSAGLHAVLEHATKTLIRAG